MTQPKQTDDINVESLISLLSCQQSLNTLDLSKQNQLKSQLLGALQQLKSIQENSPPQQPQQQPRQQQQAIIGHLNSKVIRNGTKNSESFLIITNEENKVLQSL